MRESTTGVPTQGATAPPSPPRSTPPPKPPAPPTTSRTPPGRPSSRAGATESFRIQPRVGRSHLRGLYVLSAPGPPIRGGRGGWGSSGTILQLGFDTKFDLVPGGRVLKAEILRVGVYQKNQRLWAGLLCTPSCFFCHPSLLSRFYTLSTSTCSPPCCFM